MAGARQWAPLLLCLLQSAPRQGRPHLAPPQDVTLFSQNFGVYLKWLPGPGNSQNVTYSVAYQSDNPPARWRTVASCAGTKELLCSLMCLKKQDLHRKFRGRVKVVSSGAKSLWVESKFIDYLSEVEPGPPTLTFTHTEKILIINATYQLSKCMPSMDLKYKVYFWKEHTGNKTVLPVTPYGQPVQMPIQPTTSGHLCLSGRTIYTFIASKYSQFSEPTCFFLEMPGSNWPVLQTSLLLPSLLLLIALGAIWKHSRGYPWLRRAKMPRALDFSGHLCSVATLKPSGPESPDDLILCPKKELVRRGWLSPGVRPPATLQTGAGRDSDEEEEEEEEDEESDDDFSFQPYIEPPSFLGQRGPILQLVEAKVGPADRSPQRPVQVEGSSAWQSSGSSRASPVDSAFWDEAETAQWLANKESGQEVGGDRPHEMPLRPEFSEDAGALSVPPEDSLSSWTAWDPSPAGLDPGARDSPVSLQSLTCWDSDPEEEEEEEDEDEEDEDEEEDDCEMEDSGGSSWVAESCPRTGDTAGLLGHYIAR